jgi:hypothetical protein
LCLLTGRREYSRGHKHGYVSHASLAMVLRTPE